ncbi:MAG: DinB family protein [Acidobacteriota bacterium]
MTDLAAPYDDYESQLRAVRLDAEDLLKGLSSEQANWRPATGGWSIAQCLDHLRVVDGSYVKALREGVSGAEAKGLRPDGTTPRYGFFERSFVSNMEPPAKLKLKAPKSVAPPSTLDLEEVSERFFATNRKLIDLLPAAGRVHPVRAKIRSPLARILKLSVGAAFALLAAHDRRHLWQARRVREDGSFPS